MNKVFRVGDKVYHWKYGWGIVTKKCSDDYGIEVKLHDFTEDFTTDGRVWLNEAPTLSFTEYDLIKGGFSQERPKRKPKPKLPAKGTVVYSRVFSDHHWIWVTCFYLDYNYLNHFVCSYEGLNGTTHFMSNMALENPLLHPDTPIYKAEDYV